MQRAFHLLLLARCFLPPTGRILDWNLDFEAKCSGSRQPPFFVNVFAWAIFCNWLYQALALPNSESDSLAGCILLSFFSLLILAFSGWWFW